MKCEACGRGEATTPIEKDGVVKQMCGYCANDFIATEKRGTALLSGPELKPGQWGVKLQRGNQNKILIARPGEMPSRAVAEIVGREVHVHTAPGYTEEYRKEFEAEGEVWMAVEPIPHPSLSFWLYVQNKLGGGI